ncbi:MULTISPECIES: TauD/TfdA family dioxygenase [unclassified Moritella]|uniref:TauD/TfdA family dioxygenase n=1 Tax=unclassified Moritella TaxID=2637987 RepID=UPI001BA9B8F9|nr:MULTISPECIES: TauD/TfdA family dioxygenase [unclassified Moritella]QUM86201.1 TauD/TfdA family dioxygenase [Moritella sp. 28]QUM90420.1 TauD/TfdA family dioxygenase [Moritella sp. 36]
MFTLRASHLIYNNQPFHYFWLKDNCRCNDCLHSSGQRLQEILDLDLAIKPEVVTIENDNLVITWQDGHCSHYSQDFLDSMQSCENKGVDVDHRVLWDGQLAASDITFSYPDVLSRNTIKRDWLRAVDQFGLAFLQDVPNTDKQLFEVVKQFGFVRDTNYGSHFEVISEENPVNLAYTPKPLSLHTDNAYRHPVPTLQLLHCLVSAEQGGITALTDGFYAAQLLQQRYPQQYELLTSTPVTYRFKNDETHLEHTGYIIELNNSGQLERIRLNNRSIQAIKLPFVEMAAFYEAYQNFSRILHSEECKFSCTLQPGELMIFNNERILHGREVAAEGARHLQGCYADIDSLKSTLAVLETKLETTLEIQLESNVEIK